jgi:hypothetical protein
MLAMAIALTRIRGYQRAPMAFAEHLGYFKCIFFFQITHYPSISIPLFFNGLSRQITVSLAVISFYAEHLLASEGGMVVIFL